MPPPARLRFEGHGYALVPDDENPWRGVDVVAADERARIPPPGSVPRLPQSIFNTETSRSDETIGVRHDDAGGLAREVAALRGRIVVIEALLPKVYDGMHLTDCPYVDVLLRIRETLNG